MDSISSAEPWPTPSHIVARPRPPDPEQARQKFLSLSLPAIGEANADAIHAALKATDIGDHIIYGGPIRFDEKGQNPNIGGVMLQNQNGKPVVVSPQDAAEAKPVFPLVPFDRR